MCVSAFVSADICVLHKRLTYPGSSPLFENVAIFRAVSKGQLYRLEKHRNNGLTENMHPLGNGRGFATVTCYMLCITLNIAVMTPCDVILTDGLASRLPPVHEYLY